MIRLTEEMVIKLHNMLIKETGGTSGIRDECLLLSVLNAPFQTFDSIELYPKIEEKASHLAYGIVKNHPFIDGNKRIGLFSMLVFLEINGVKLEHTQQELIQIGLGLANNTLTLEDVLLFINDHKK